MDARIDAPTVLNHHRYHILTLKVGYTDRLLGKDLGKWIRTSLISDPVKYYPGGEITGVKYPVLKRLYNSLEESEIDHVAVLWVDGEDGRHFDCVPSGHDDTLDPNQFTEHPATESIFAAIQGRDNSDIVVAFSHNPVQWEPVDMSAVYKFIGELMELKHCAMFDYDNVVEQYDYTITVNGHELKCLHIEFDTESG